MNKKSIDKITNLHQYNELLFASAVDIAQNFRNIITKTDSLPPQDKPFLQEK